MVLYEICRIGFYIAYWIIFTMIVCPFVIYYAGKDKKEHVVPGKLSLVATIATLIRNRNNQVYRPTRVQLFGKLEEK